MESSRFSEIFEDYKSGKIGRRHFLEGVGKLGLSVAASNMLMESAMSAPEAVAAIKGPEERAWALAKQAAVKATKKSLTLLIPTGSIGNMAPYAEVWKKGNL